LEDEEPAVLEEATEQRADVDVQLAPAPARPEGARRPREDLDLDARVGRGVELGDDLLVGEVVHLEPDPRLLARSGGRGATAGGPERRMCWTSAGRIVNGATSSLRNARGRPNPVRWLNRSARSAVISSSAVKRLKSS